MRIIVAKTAGFCFGVKRAVDLALEHSSKSSHEIFTLGPLIHNNQTIEMLKQRKVLPLDEQNTPDKPSTLLIRAHGVPPDTQKKYSDQGHEIIDGTCPKVKTVHKVIERYRAQGYTIVITGDEGHAEVIGLLGYAGDAGHLIQTESDVDKLPDFDKVCLVSQTTFDRNLFEQISLKIKNRFGDERVVVKKTICAATDQRQGEIENLAQQVDALLVVGSKTSANTKRLAQIAMDKGIPTQLVETENDIKWEPLSKCKTIGISAGASTPNWMIKRVTDYVQFLEQTQRKGIQNIFLNLLDNAANLNVFVSIGAIALYYVSCFIQSLPFSPIGAATAFAYFMSMYLWNSLANTENTQHLGLSRYQFYKAHKKTLYITVGISTLIVLCLSAAQGTHLLYLMLIAVVAGTAYHFTTVPKFLRKFIKYKNVKDIPTSRDFFIALAWGTVLTWIPQAIRGYLTIEPITIAVFTWIFILAYLRSLIFDLRDIEGDRIMGRETLITIVGEKRARKAIYLIIIICAILLLISPAMFGLNTYKRLGTTQFLCQIPVLLYAILFLRYNPKLKSRRTSLFSLLADGFFYIAAGGAALIATLVK